MRKLKDLHSVRSFSSQTRKKERKSRAKKTKGKKESEDKKPAKGKNPEKKEIKLKEITARSGSIVLTDEIIEEKPENLEEQIKQGEEKISDSGFVEFLRPAKKTAPVLERVAVQRNVELENKIAGVPAGRTGREERIVNYSETKPDYSATANVERRENPRDPGYADRAATYSSIQKKDETGRGIVNPIKSEWEAARKRRDRPDVEVGSFDRIEREKQDRKYTEKGTSEYYR
ncbi:hypothetical protein HY449_00315 [Candidatus Pacearchaeota archaeon]|nr:hypothetical protein [Candidatus Pacearchaeota archaeon]